MWFFFLSEASVEKRLGIRVSQVEVDTGRVDSRIGKKSSEVKNIESAGELFRGFGGPQKELRRQYLGTSVGGRKKKKLRRQDRHKHGNGNGSEAEEAGGFSVLRRRQQKGRKGGSETRQRRIPPRRKRIRYIERRSDNQTSNERAGVGRKKEGGKKEGERDRWLTRRAREGRSGWPLNGIGSRASLIAAGQGHRFQEGNALGGAVRATHLSACHSSILHHVAEAVVRAELAALGPCK